MWINEFADKRYANYEGRLRVKFCFYLDSDGLKVLGNVDENGDDEDGNGELDPSSAHRLRRDGRAVFVGVADRHVPLVGDRDDYKD